MQRHLINRRFVPLFSVALAAAIFGQAPSAFAQNNDWAKKMFDKLSHDFGKVARGADVQYRFRVKNIYKQTVHISNVRTTCGCSAATPTKRTLKTYETADIIVTMNTQKFLRQKDSNLIITFDKPLFATVRIPIRAYIRPDVVLRPGSVKFGAIEQGKSFRKSLSIAYAGRRDWKIERVKINSPYLSGTVKQISRSGGRVRYQLSVTLKPGAPVGILREQIVLVTNDANSPFVPVAVTAHVESEFTVTTAPLGTVKPGQKKVFNVVIRGRRPFRVDKLICANSPDCFQAKLSGKSRSVHVISITFVPPKKVGAFQETLKFSIAGRKEPVAFRVTGRIVKN